MKQNVVAVWSFATGMKEYNLGTNTKKPHSKILSRPTKKQTVFVHELSYKVPVGQI